MRKEIIQRFLGIPEHYVRHIYFLDKEGHEAKDDKSVETVIVEVARETHRFRCICGREYGAYYDCRDQFVRDLPWGPWGHVELLVPRFRVQCDRCGVKTEPLDWIVRNCTYTRRLAEAIALACREVRSISAIADSFGLSWGTVKEIDKSALKKELNPPVLDGLEYLAIDEFSLKRRHQYATIFLDIERNQVVWVCKSRKKEAVAEVFKNVFGADVCEGIKAVAMDMWEAYESAARECLPNAEVVWDRFHIVKNYNRDVVDRVRKDEARKKLATEEQQAMKKSRYILLKNRKNMMHDELARLRCLLSVNRRLFTVDLLREALGKLWDYSYEGAARNWFESWYSRAIRSRIEPLKRFARRLKARIHGVLSHCRHPIHTGILEGINNKVKVIKRVAYGYRDHEYFFLKIRGHYNSMDPL